MPTRSTSRRIDVGPAGAARRARPAAGHPAFTLVELMVAMTAAALMVVGITYVFKATSDTVGTGYATTDAMRTQKSIQSMLANDFIGYDRPGDTITSGIERAYPNPVGQPAIIIHCERNAAFRDARDQQADNDFAAALSAYQASSTPDNEKIVDHTLRTYDPYLKGTDDPLAGGVLTPLAIYNFRNHRCDTLSFFTTGTISRQTGDNSYVADFGTQEAWVWYGHLDQYNGTIASGSVMQDSTNFPTVGTIPTTATPNVTNWYASNWALGRQAIVLGQPQFQTADSTWRIYDVDGQYQTYIGRSTSAPPDDLAPLSSGSLATQDGTYFPNRGVEPWAAWMMDSRYDLAGATIAEFSDVTTPGLLRPAPWNAATTYPSGATVSRNGILYHLPPSAGPSTGQDPALGGPWEPWNWWSRLFATQGRRFWANPYVAKPLTPQNMAQNSPILATGCVQFIVEYAGDYITQDPVQFSGPNIPNPTYGDITDVGPDGQIDFVYVHRGPWDNITTYSAGDYVLDSGQFYVSLADDNLSHPPAGSPTFWRVELPPRAIRWYGFPRDVVGRHVIDAIEPNDPDPDIYPQRLVHSLNVVPLRDVLAVLNPSSATPATPAPFERDLPTPKRNYSAGDTVSGGTVVYNGLNYGESYTCAWGPYDLFPVTGSLPAPWDAKVALLPADKQTLKPYLIRITVTLVDANGRLADGISQEYVYPVR